MAVVTVAMRGLWWYECGACHLQHVEQSRRDMHMFMRDHRLNAHDLSTTYAQAVLYHWRPFDDHPQIQVG